MVQGTGREGDDDEIADLKTFQVQGKTYLVVPEVLIGNCEFCHFQSGPCNKAVAAYQSKVNSDGCSADNVIFIRPENYETYRITRVTNKLRGI